MVVSPQGRWGYLTVEENAIRLIMVYSVLLRSPMIAARCSTATVEAADCLLRVRLASRLCLPGRVAAPN